MIKTKRAREVGGVIVVTAALCTIGTVACKVDVISGDDGEGGQGGAGVASSSYVSTSATGLGPVGTTGYSVSYSAATGPSSVYTTGVVGSTAGSGMCPPEAQWPSDCASVAATGSGTGYGPKYCYWQQDCAPDPAIFIECDETTGLCTCTGSGESCFCNWNIPSEGGFCGVPCCGGTPDTF